LKKWKSIGKTGMPKLALNRKKGMLVPEKKHLKADIAL
jgi:hypothetical protein